MLSDYLNRNSCEKPFREDSKGNSDVEEPLFVASESIQKVEDNNWMPESEGLLQIQIPESFSTETLPIIADEPAKDVAEFPESNLLIIEPAQLPQPIVEDSNENCISDHLPKLITPQKTDPSTIKEEPKDTLKLPNDEVMKESVLTSEIRIENLTINPKLSKVISHPIKNEPKSLTATPLLKAQTFEAPQSSNNLLNLQHFDILNSIGIKSAPKEGDRKGGLVSSNSNVLIEFDDPLHRESSISSNGSRVAEILSQKTDTTFSNDLGQHFESKEMLLPPVQSKVAVDTYETVQQEQSEVIQGIIATLEQQIDEIKRSRRNSVVVKIDLEDGESLNCQITLAQSDVAIRFPMLEENFKTQILNHWESLRRFAETRKLNLAEPQFVDKTSL